MDWTTRGQDGTRYDCIITLTHPSNSFEKRYSARNHASWKNGTAHMVDSIQAEKGFVSVSKYLLPFSSMRDELVTTVVLTVPSCPLYLLFWKSDQG